MTDIATQKKMIGTFAGINQSDVINENEFADMENLSSDFYPAAGPRQPRGIVCHTLERPNGLHYNNGLAYVDGTKFYYKGNLVGNVEDSRKQMVNLGAYIVIFPDKRVYNTRTGEWKSVEAKWTQSSEAAFTPTITGSTFIKISSTGIGKEFVRGDGILISGCTNSGFNKSAIIQSAEANAIVIIGDLDAEFTQKSGLVIERKAPDIDYVTEAENRLWGCSSTNHEVYASKLGDPLNWNCFEGISTDSYAATIGSEGDFTGAVTHLGYVLFFKENMIHKVYGNKPGNIQINAYPARGVKKGCENSLIVVNETLYYASCDGVCAYDGSMPYLISENIKKRYSRACAGSYRGKYYVSMEMNETWELYVYDTNYHLWHKEDKSLMQAVCVGDGEMFYIDGENRLRGIEGADTERIFWSMESGDQMDGGMNKKRLHKLQFFLELEQGAMAEVYLQYEGGKWERIRTITAPRKQSLIFPIRPRRCSHYRWKLAGSGKFILYGVGKVYETGTGR